MQDLFTVIKAVLLNSKVVAAAVVCLVLMNFASYICRYRKKPPRQRVKRVYAAPPPAGKEDDGQSGADNAESGQA